MRASFVAAVLTGCAAMAPVDAADPRFEACGGAVDSVDATVAFTARDYREHFPLMGKAPELDADAPAFAVVFAEGAAPRIPITGQLRRGDQHAAPPPAKAEHRTVCIYVGMPPDGVMNYYVDVDVALLLP
jgi:hypothetical protein